MKIRKLFKPKECFNFDLFFNFKKSQSYELLEEPKIIINNNIIHISSFKVFINNEQIIINSSKLNYQNGLLSFSIKKENQTKKSKYNIFPSYYSSYNFYSSLVSFSGDYPIAYVNNFKLFPFNNLKYHYDTFILEGLHIYKDRITPGKAFVKGELIEVINPYYIKFYGDYWLTNQGEILETNYDEIDSSVKNIKVDNSNITVNQGSIFVKEEKNVLQKFGSLWLGKNKTESKNRHINKNQINNLIQKIEYTEKVLLNLKEIKYDKFNSLSKTNVIENKIYLPLKQDNLFISILPSYTEKEFLNLPIHEKKLYEEETNEFHYINKNNEIEIYNFTPKIFNYSELLIGEVKENIIFPINNIVRYKGNLLSLNSNYPKVKGIANKFTIINTKIISSIAGWQGLFSIWDSKNNLPYTNKGWGNNFKLNNLIVLEAGEYFFIIHPKKNQEINISNTGSSLVYKNNNWEIFSQSISYSLYSAKPNFIKEKIQYELNYPNFNSLDIETNKIDILDSSLEILYEKFFPRTNKKLIEIVYNSNANYFTLLKYLKVNISLIENQGCFISINEERQNYNFVSLQLNVIGNINLNCYFSSNQGQSWEELQNKNFNYFESNILSDTVDFFNVNNTSFKIKRKSCMVRIDYNSPTPYTNPFIELPYILKTNYIS